MSKWGIEAPVIRLKAKPEVGARETLYEFDLNNLEGIQISTPIFTKLEKESEAVNGNLLKFFKGFRFEFIINYELENNTLSRDFLTFLDRMKSWNEQSVIIKDLIEYTAPEILLIPHRDNTTFTFIVNAYVGDYQYIKGIMIGYSGSVEFRSIQTFQTIP